MFFIVFSLSVGTLDGIGGGTGDRLLFLMCSFEFSAFEFSLLSSSATRDLSKILILASALFSSGLGS